jgi:hypothetical protein
MSFSFTLPQPIHYLHRALKEKSYMERPEGIQHTGKEEVLRSFCTPEAGGSPGSFAAEAGADTGRRTEEE